MAFNKFFTKETQVTIDPDIKALNNALLKHAYKSYKKITKKKRFPLLEDMAGSGLEKVMGYVALVRYDEFTPQFTYDVVGKNLLALYGKDISGLTINQAYERKLAQEIIQIYEQVRTHKCPVYSQSTWKTLLRDIGYCKLILPFQDLRNNVSIFLSCITPSDLNIKTEKDWKEAGDVQAMNNILKLK